MAQIIFHMKPEQSVLWLSRTVGAYFEKHPDRGSPSFARWDLRSQATQTIPISSTEELLSWALSDPLVYLRLRPARAHVGPDTPSDRGHVVQVQFGRIEGRSITGTKLFVGDRGGASSKLLAHLKKKILEVCHRGGTCRLASGEVRTVRLLWSPDLIDWDLSDRVPVADGRTVRSLESMPLASIRRARAKAVERKSAERAAAEEARQEHDDVTLDYRCCQSDLEKLVADGNFAHLRIQFATDDIGLIVSLEALRSLHLSSLCSPDLAPLTQLPRLETLSIGAQLLDSCVLPKLHKLRSLSIKGAAAPNLNPLAKLRKLTSLTIDAPVRDLSPLSTLKKLQRLSLLQAEGVKTLAPLSGLTKLKELLLPAVAVKSLAPLSKLTRLQWLDVSDVPVRSARPLAQVVRLEHLQLAGTQISDLRPIAKLRSLKSLDLTSVPVGDLGPLATLTSLEELNLGHTELDDLSPLFELPSLRHVRLEHATIRQGETRRLKAAWRRAGIQAEVWGKTHRAK